VGVEILGGSCGLKSTLRGICEIGSCEIWGHLCAIEVAWRGLLSLRDPTALPGRSGHPMIEQNFGPHYVRNSKISASATTNRPRLITTLM
jgi:hypothetical protein